MSGGRWGEVGAGRGLCVRLGDGLGLGLDPGPALLCSAASVREPHFAGQLLTWAPA